MVTARAATLAVASKALTPIQTCTLTATPSSSTVETDAYVNQNAPTTNTGGANFVDAQSSSAAGGSNRRPYLRFDLTKCPKAIPSTATVKVSTLRLYVTAVPAVCRTEDIFRVTAAWVEGTITWNNQPFGTSINNPPTGNRTDAITVGAAPCQNTGTNVYVNGWTVTADVQAFVAGTASNFGWMIRDDVESSATARNARFTSRDANVLAQAPQLVITYTV
jgi:hypothetical protein